MVPVTGLRRGGKPVAAEKRGTGNLLAIAHTMFVGFIVEYTRHEVPQPVVRGAKRVLYPKKCVGRIASQRGALLLGSWVRFSLPSELFTSQKLSVHTTDAH